MQQDPSTPLAAPAGDDPQLLTDRAAIVTAVADLAAAARRELLIFSHDLEPFLYDQQNFLTEVRRLAVARSWLPVRVLVCDARKPVVAGHRLLDLSRTLGSRISIRRVGDDFRDRPDAFLIADAGYCLRQLADRYEALVQFHAPGPARRLKAEFEQIWEHSDEDTELRRLDL